MLRTIGTPTVQHLIEATIPSSIRNTAPLSLGDGIPESEMLDKLRSIAARNQVFTSYIGMGYTNTITPPVILRNILENPGWYTQYTPYQPEIAQGRLTSLMNFQTMVTELTGLPVANASLLDEGTAAGEAMVMCFASAKEKKKLFFVDRLCHPQTIACVKTRAEGFGIEVVVGPFSELDVDACKDVLMGVLVQVSLSRNIIVECC
jgi:glycine dehydrogenase